MRPIIRMLYLRMFYLRMFCVGATGLLLGGCSTIDRTVARERTATTEETLTAAGFHIEPADTAERLALLKALPPLDLVAGKNGDETIYTYGDPVSCKCFYVGNAQAYTEYQRLRAERRLANEWLAAPRIDDETTIDGARPAEAWW
ncbi:MAG: hypothetical protein QOD06_2547 [Candidatus Binatota bacterium]|nr:hypothetical protein [Candidatus Binatota bacterium]